MLAVRGGRLLLTALIIMQTRTVQAAEVQVKITPAIDAVTVDHAGDAVRVERNQDQTNTIQPNFQRTSRKCPPYCIQPMQIPGGVETIGEIEMLDYLQRRDAGDDSIMIIDSRSPTLAARGTIPGARNIYYRRLSLRSAKDTDIARMLEEEFGAKRKGELWNFRNAKTLVMFCNGAWCGQSPTNIRSLMRMGYPPTKIKWYRGGMQSWETVGLTTAAREAE